MEDRRVQAEIGQDDWRGRVMRARMREYERRHRGEMSRWERYRDEMGREEGRGRDSSEGRSERGGDDRRRRDEGRDERSYDSSVGNRAVSPDELTGMVGH